MLASGRNPSTREKTHPGVITMLTVRQAAARASVCERIVRNWIRSGILPHYRIGATGRRGKIMIDESDLDALMASFRVDSGPGPKPPACVRHAAVPELKHLRVK